MLYLCKKKIISRVRTRRKTESQLYRQYRRLRDEARRRGIDGTNGETVDNAIDRMSRLDRIFDRYQQNIHKAYMRPIERMQERGDYESANRQLDKLREKGYGRGDMPLSRSVYMSGNAG